MQGKQHMLHEGIKKHQRVLLEQNEQKKIWWPMAAEIVGKSGGEG